MTKYEPELDMNHPGFSDKEYRVRRKMIAEIAFAYKFGHPIPHIEYVQTEIDTWNAVFGHVCELSKQHACKEYIDVFEMLKQEGIFTMGAVPQLQDMNDFLKSEFFIRTLNFTRVLILFCFCRAHWLYASPRRRTVDCSGLPRLPGIQGFPEHPVCPSPHLPLPHPWAVSIFSIPNYII